MKNLTLVGILILASVVSSFAQSTNAATSVASPAVIAADMQEVDAKKCTPEEKKACETTAVVKTIGHACCASSTASTSTAGAELSKEAAKCQSVSFGLGASKPEKEAPQQ